MHMKQKDTDMAHEHKITNEVIINTIQELVQASGGLLAPADLVEAARPETSPLHRYFQWDDTEAAKQYRIVQARGLLRVCVRYEPSGNEKLEVRVFASLPQDREKEGGGYRMMVEVLSDEILRAQLLIDAQNELNRFKIKYARLTELAHIFAAIETLEETIRPTVVEPPVVEEPKS